MGDWGILVAMIAEETLVNWMEKYDLLIKSAQNDHEIN